MASLFLPLPRTATTTSSSSTSLLVAAFTQHLASHPTSAPLLKTCLHLHLYCCFWMFHAQIWRTCSCVALLVSTKRTAALSLASQLHLQCRACQVRLLTFTQKSLHLSRTCLQTHFWLSLRSHFIFQERACKLTFDFHSRSHFTSQERACKCTFDFHAQATSLRFSSHSGRLVTEARSLLWSCHPVLASLILTSGATYPAAQDAHCLLGLPSLWLSHPALASFILPSGAAQDAHCGLGFAHFTVSA